MKDLKSYCEKTTLHGFSYLADKRLHRAEKLFLNTVLLLCSYKLQHFTSTFRAVWIAMLIVSFICTLLMLNKLVVKIQQNPIVIVQSEVATKVTNIEFPAVTFCPGLWPASKLPNSTDYLDFLKMLNLINMHVVNYTKEQEAGAVRAINIWALSSEDNEDFYKYSIQLSPYDLRVSHHANVMFYCHGNWMEIFRVPLNKLTTRIGGCHSFNKLPNEIMFKKSISDYLLYSQVTEVEDLLMDRWPEKFNQKRPYKTTNKDLGLEMHIIEGSRRFEVNRESFNMGYELMIHNPYAMPDETIHRFHLSINESYIVYVKPHLTTIDDTLLNLLPEERNCYMPHEKSLNFFKFYTIASCKIECVSNLELEKCGCVAFYHPHMNTTRICTLKERKCYETVQKEFNEKLNINCKCLQPCEQIDYEVEIRKKNFVKNKFIDRNLWFNEWRLKTEFKVMFKESEFYPMIRRKHFTEIDILSFVGGLLGLFLGFSLLSFVEIAYHFSIRILIRKQLSSTAKIKVVKPFRRMHKHQQWHNKLKNILIEYMRESSVHGFSYISDSKLHFVERLFWLIAFLSSMTGCVFMIKELRNKLGINSITMILSDESQSVSTLPFPAVTMYGSLKANYFQLYWSNTHRFEIPTSLTESEVDMFIKHHLEHIIADETDYAFYFPDYNFTGYQHVMIETLRNYSKVDWIKDQKGLWNQMFQVPLAQILSTRGFGVSFNILEANDLYRLEQVSEDFLYVRNLTMDGGKLKSKENFPWNASLKENDALELKIKVETGNQTKLYYAFSIHSTNEPPIFLDKDYAIEFDGGKMIQVSITPNVITTDNDLKSFDVEDRLCYSDNERQLKFFKVYTQRNCLIECFSNFTLEVCGCVPFNVVRSASTTLCELLDYYCVQDLQYEMKFDSESKKFKTCNCLQNCNSVSYDFEFIDNRFSNPNQSEAVIRIMFKHPEFTPFRRFRQFTFIDFLSYVGGLLGLFAGISVLSFFEILYFAIPRLLTNFLKSSNKIHCQDVST